jgi:aminoglycoside 6-adenylyltransferase
LSATLKHMKSRNEQQMMGLILGTAEADPNIRTVVLEGSRASPTASKDPFQDYDIIYGVTDLTPYRSNLNWVRRFGELMVLQMPDGMGSSPSVPYKFTYLMQFTDGTRIDLNLYHLDQLKSHTFSSQSLVLLDKDSWLNLPPPNESDYFPSKPRETEFFDCCNEFWWVTPYVAKGLWRGDLAYARHMFDTVLRSEAMKMTTWYFGIKTDFKENPGKCGHRFSDCIEPELIRLLQASYKAGTIEETWNALESLCSLFRSAGSKVAAHFQFHYPSEEDKNVTAYLRHIIALPADSATIY